MAMQICRSRHILLVGFAAFLSLVAAAQDITERAEGFVTQIDSATAFDVGTLHVTLNGQMPCSIRSEQAFLLTGSIFGYAGPWIQYFVKKRPFRRRETVSMSCDTRHLAIGDYVLLSGATPTGGKMSCTEAVVLAMVGQKQLQGAALLEEQPNLSLGRQGWSGTLWLDGYPIAVSPQTKMLAAPADTTIRYRYRSGPIRVSAHLHTRNVTTLFPAGLLRPNTWVTYEAVRTPDHNITATQLRFWPNRVGTKERKYLARFAATIDAPDYARHIPGSIKFPRQKSIEILPDRAMQDWVSTVGMEMVPQYQKYLPDTDPTRIHFRFFVVQPFVATGTNFLVDTDGALPYYKFMRRVIYNSPILKAMVKDVVAMPNGLILVPDSAFASLRNRAQLAALLSYAIASVLQKQAYLAWPLITAPHTKYVNGIPEGPDGADGIGQFWTMQNEQVLRVGLRQMLHAGYDLREAPFAWSAGLGKPIENPVASGKDSSGSTRIKHKIPWYAGYSMNFLSHYYAGTDYSKLRRGDAEYAKFLDELHRADPSLRPIREQK